MISSNFDKGNQFHLISLKKEAETTDTLLNLFENNKQEQSNKMDFKNVFSDPIAELSKYAKLAMNSTDLGNINPNQMNFPSAT